MSQSTSLTSGVIWAVFGTILRQATGLVVNIVLARMLGPGAYGAAVLVLTITGFSALITDSGLGTALVQKKDVADQEYRFVSGVQILLGCSQCVLIYFFFDDVLRYINNHSLNNFALAICLIVILNSFGQLPTIILKRRFEVKSIQLAQFVSYLFGYALVGIALAFKGYGTWSLVIAQVVQSALNTAILVYLSKNVYSPSLRGGEHIISFGLKTLLANILNWIASVADTLIMARFFSGATVGAYNRIVFVLLSPSGVVSAVVNSVLLRHTAELFHRGDGLGKYYQSLTQLVATIILPFLLCIAVIPQTFVEGLYGSRWLIAVPMVLPSCVIVVITALATVPGPMLRAIGRPGDELRASVMTVIISLPALWIAGHFSLSVFLWTVVLSRLIFLLHVNYSVSKSLNFNSWMYLRAILRPTVLAVILGAVSFATDQILLILGMDRFIILSTVFLVDLLILSLLLLFHPSLLFSTSVKEVVTSSHLHIRAVRTVQGVVPNRWRERL